MPPKIFFPDFPDKETLLTIAYLTLKNSSKLFEKIPRNLNRSINGVFESSASCKTRALKSSQLISLFINLFPIIGFF